MASTFSADLRKQVIDHVEAGATARCAAAIVGVGASTAIAWVRRWREAGERTARRRGNPGGSKLDAHGVFLLGVVETDPDIGLAEIAQRLVVERGVSVGISTLWRFYQARGLTVEQRRARARGLDRVVRPAIRSAGLDDQTASLG